MNAQERKVYNRQWKFDNADKHNEQSKKYYRAKQVKALKKKQNDRFNLTNIHGRESPIEKEILHHLSRGRDAATIAVRMNQPMSRVEAAIKKLQKPVDNPQAVQAT